jgi:integrase/recombinase XerD
VKLPAKPRTTGHAPWSSAEIDAFRSRWPIGTSKRAAFELLHWTGFRIGDAVLIGPGHVDRLGVLVHSQSKVKEPAFVPWSGPLPPYAEGMETDRAMMLDAIGAASTGHMTFLATASGQTRSDKALGNMIREAARAAGVEKSAHGLRKSRGISLAEAGASAHQIMSWLGHQTLKESEHYTRLASRRRAVMGPEQDGNVATPAAQSAT